MLGIPPCPEEWRPAPPAGRNASVDIPPLSRRHTDRVTVRTVCYIEVNGLYVHAEILGETFSARCLESRFALTLPGSPTDSEWVAALPGRNFWGSFVVAKDSNGTTSAQEVLIVRTTMETDRDVSIADSRQDLLGRTSAQARMARDQRRALRLLDKALNALRVQSRQSWLGWSAQRVRVARTDFFDTHGERLTVEQSPMRSGSGRFAGPMRAANRDLVATALAEAEKHRDPPLPESLLADAEYLLGQGQHREALLLAAIAAETGVRHTLQVAASESQEPLVTLLLNSPREYPMAAASLFDKAMFAINQRSVKVEQPHTWKGVVRLFEDRNKVAHGTGDVEWRTVKTHISTAYGVLHWLRGIESAPLRGPDEAFGVDY